MIIAVGSDKNAPLDGATLAVLLGLVWPGGPAVVTELDPRGAVLPFRLPRMDGQVLRVEPSVASLAIEARAGTTGVAVERFAQPTMLEVPVIAGEPSAAANAKLSRLLPLIGEVAEAWPGTLIADLGELQAGNPALAVAQRAAVVLLLVRPDAEGLARLRDRVDELGGQVGDPAHGRVTLGVVTAAPAGAAHAVTTRVERVLAAVGSPVPMVGVLADDPAAAALLWRWQPGAGKKLTRSRLVRSAVQVAARMRQLWPDLDRDTGASRPDSAPPAPAEPAATDPAAPPRVWPAPPPPPPPPPAPVEAVDSPGRSWSGPGPGWEWPPRPRASGEG